MIPNEWLAQSPFGSRISIDDIEANLAFFDDWEERYRYIIDLGKELPPMDPQFQTAERLIRGCQSQVWLVQQVDDQGKLQLMVQSDALIVRGLIALVLAAYQGRPRAEVPSFDIEGLFARLDLLQHLSPTRGNGLRALVAQIRNSA